ncbi:MAG: 3-deoxy-D-manno-octulosonic acid transferase [Rhodobiaceae bacterium]|nr:3-deoxy-D-manno-octulosonic acid transferase [Rhodobiaceae bacterium]
MNIIRKKILFLYIITTSILGIFINFYFTYRIFKNKENKESAQQKSFKNVKLRPLGTLIWIHASSVGESLSALPLIELIIKNQTFDNILFTTSTITSKAIIENRISDKVLHQYLPLDTIFLARRFLNHWKPNSIAFIESEIWPNFFQQIKKIDVPFYIANARMSENSFKKWKKYNTGAKELLSAADIIFAQDSTAESKFKILGVSNICNIGNIKFDSSPLPVDKIKYNSLKAKFDKKIIFVAGSTHKIENFEIVKIHQSLSKQISNLMTIIVPRQLLEIHALEKFMVKNNISYSKKSNSEDTNNNSNLLIVDTMGELGLYYKIANIAFIGGSLINKGGQNPIEALQFDCPVLHGKHTSNFHEIYKNLDKLGGAIRVNDEKELESTLIELIKDTKTIKNMNKANANLIKLNQGASVIIERILSLNTQGD